MLLSKNLHGKSSSLMLILLPTLSRIVARPILLNHVLAVHFDKGAFDVGHVLGFGHGTGDGRFVVGEVGGEHGAGACGVDLPGRVTDLSELGLVQTCAPADDGLREVLPETRFELHGDFAGVGEEGAVDGAFEEAGVAGEMPEFHEVQGYAVENVVEVFNVVWCREGVGSGGLPGYRHCFVVVVPVEAVDLSAVLDFVLD